jgi:hypothetical protein
MNTIAEGLSRLLEKMSETDRKTNLLPIIEQVI